ADTLSALEQQRWHSPLSVGPRGAGPRHAPPRAPVCSALAVMTAPTVNAVLASQELAYLLRQRAIRMNACGACPVACVVAGRARVTCRLPASSVARVTGRLIALCITSLACCTSR